jgi:uncharacterized protein YbbK (DUF523 family)
MILVSACLLGLCPRYDGGHNLCPPLLAPGIAARCLPVCPEQIGGLPTPRQPCEILGGTGADVLAGRAKVIDPHGADLTAPFVHGARQLAGLASSQAVAAAILKARSPSCGVGQIYDGTFTHRLIAGNGVAAAALAELGIPLYTELDLSEEVLARLTGAGR